jgi:hypothetical protein
MSVPTVYCSEDRRWQPDEPALLGSSFRDTGCIQGAPRRTVSPAFVSLHAFGQTRTDCASGHAGIFRARKLKLNSVGVHVAGVVVFLL